MLQIIQVKGFWPLKNQITQFPDGLRLELSRCSYSTNYPCVDKFSFISFLHTMKLKHVVFKFGFHFRSQPRHRSKGINTVV